VDNYSFKLGLDFSFERKLPALARVASMKQFRTLDTTQYADCKTAQQLRQFA
jgi:hypothetical protein